MNVGYKVINGVNAGSHTTGTNGINASSAIPIQIVKAIKQPGIRSNPRPTSLNRMRPNTSGAPGTTAISGNSKQQ